MDKSTLIDRSVINSLEMDLGSEVSEKRTLKLLEIQESLNVVFRNICLLNQALTHSSFFPYQKEKKKTERKNNQRLEFLGDSFLSLTTSELLYKRFPNFSEGKLSKIKNYIVSEKILYKIAKTLKLGDYLLMSFGEMKSQGNTKPSVLADAFEALIGALYLDQGLTGTQQFLSPLLEKEIDYYFQDKSLSIDYKSELQYIVQKKYKTFPTYSLVEDRGPNHHKEFMMSLSIIGNEYARACAKTKKEAEQKAARIVFDKIKAKEIIL
jgi:ribonuclease-3